MIFRGSVFDLTYSLHKYEPESMHQHRLEGVQLKEIQGVQLKRLKACGIPQCNMRRGLHTGSCVKTAYLGDDRHSITA